MIKEKIMELVSLAFEIQERGKGCNGYPYIRVGSSNYTENIEIIIEDMGFNSSKNYDGVYEFRFDSISERTYQNCKQHLTELFESIPQMPEQEM